MELIKLPLEVCNAIDFYKNPPKGIYTKWENRSIVNCVLNEGQYDDSYEPTLEVLRSIPFNDLLSALVNGFTVEESKEDRARKYYKEQINIERGYEDLPWEAMTRLLNILEIEVEGISDQNY
jgi:hypothetical protein